MLGEEEKEARNPAAEATRFKFRNHLGVACLTKDPDNHLMWVNHAQRHTGFVIGYKTVVIDQKLNLKPREVIYANEPTIAESLLKPPEEAAISNQPIGNMSKSGGT
jgi:hypothetical protein